MGQDRGQKGGNFSWMLSGFGTHFFMKFLSLRLPTFSPIPNFGEGQRTIGESEKRAATFERMWT